ncbi:N-alpha-acetyltransferase 40 [Scaptodrosophila lebanonensis]|uniref:N-alpha-acetyltransferase 40 n=1 Tax=Drosophila lebanonensis TaxID=7225 RepID=A0A6J2T2U5_DROLE|nr:N-alpha-acetyltransferase 40 [Scaptodrosophila lebanonensis]
MTNGEEISASAKQKHIEAAARAKNPLENLPYRNYKSAACGQEFELYCRAKNDLDAKTLKWAFKLAEINVAPFYKQLKMGWQPKIKQAELNKNWARYLVAQNAEKQPVAYAMFRFDIDDGDSVLYCYEMQVSAPCQRKGLGKFMMQTLEACARHFQMEKIMLTVLKNNENSITFFNALGYIKDETSPDVLAQADYQILSKSTLV